MKNVDSVLQFADSAIIGRINYEMRKVLENISNPKIRTKKQGNLPLKWTSRR